MIFSVYPDSIAATLVCLPSHINWIYVVLLLFNFLEKSLLIISAI